MVETMRSMKIKRILRFCNWLLTVFSVLALLLVFKRVADPRWKSSHLKRTQTNEILGEKGREQRHDIGSVHGRLAVQVWKNICGGKLINLFRSPFFPKFFDELYFITRTRAQLNTSNYGQRIFGFLHPPETGYYNFVLYSDDGSEFWFADTGSVEHFTLSARVGSRETIASAPVDEIRFETQISGDFFLERGKKYPFEIIHLQGSELDFVELQWIRPGKHTLEVIGSKHISCCSEFLANSRTVKKLGVTPKEGSKPYLVAYLTERIVQRTLPNCAFPLSNKPVKPYLPRFHGYRAVKEITKVTGYWDENWRINEEAKNIVELYMGGLEKIFPRKYLVKRFFSLERFPFGNENKAILYLVEFELGCDALDYTERVVEYVYLQRKSQQDALNSHVSLCYPMGLDWKREATVHLMLAVYNEGQLLRRFIEKLEVIVEDSLEVDFSLVIVHFARTADVNIKSVLQQSSLQRYKVHRIEGDFSRSRAINEGLQLVHNADDIILTCDVHVDLPPTIFEDSRKHCLDGKMVYAPVLYSLNCGAYPDKPQGSWCSHDYRMIGMYQGDWTAVGGLDETVEDQLVTLDLVDRILARGLHVARPRTSNLYLLYHSESREPYGPMKGLNASGFFREGV